jgi:putative hydrolase of the HAD superfamily
LDAVEGIKLITFDAGHTLIRPHPSIGHVYTRVTEEFGVRVEPEVFTSATRPIFLRAFKSLPADGRAASDEEDRAMWSRITRELYDEIPEMAAVDFERWFDRLYTVFGSGRTWRYYEGAQEILATLRNAGFTLGLISNWDTRLRKIAEELGIVGIMDAVAISSEVGFRKPSRRIFDTVTEQLKMRPEEAVHVGDLLEEDVKGALNAGWRAILIDRHDSGAPEGDWTVIRDLSELIGLIASPGGA